MLRIVVLLLFLVVAAFVVQGGPVCRVGLSARLQKTPPGLGRPSIVVAFPELGLEFHQEVPAEGAAPTRDKTMECRFSEDGVEAQVQFHSWTKPTVVSLTVRRDGYVTRRMRSIALRPGSGRLEGSVREDLPLHPRQSVSH